jgi:hypothetical protein
MTSALTRPEPRRIIPKSVVDALIADADRQISALERQAERALAAADEAEARLDELGIDECASAWATIQLERFVTSLRDDIAIESDAILAEARVRAQTIVDDATYDTGVAHADPELIDLDPIELDAVVSTARIEPVVVPEVVVPVPVVPVVPVVVPEQVVVPEPFVPEAEVEVDPVFAAILPQPLASEEDDAGTGAGPSSDSSFWSDEEERPHRFRRPNKRTVAIQGSALALLIAAAVVRFG